MQEKSIVYFIVAWLSCWMVDLVMMVARNPPMIDSIMKLIIVAVCLIIVLIGLSKANWLL